MVGMLVLGEGKGINNSSSFVGSKCKKVLFI